MPDDDLKERLRANHTIIATTVVPTARAAQALETRAMDAGLAVEARDWPCSVTKKDAQPQEAQMVEIICPKSKAARLMAMMEDAPDATGTVALHVTDPAMGSLAYERWADSLDG